MDDKIQELCSLRPLSVEEATKLLKEAGGNVELALDLYSMKKKQKEKEKQGQEKKFATLGSSSHDSEDEDDHGHDDEEGQEFFAGGKASGVAIKGPTKNSKELVGGILKKAEKGGKKDLEEKEKDKSKPSKSFQKGKAYRLGTETEESVEIGTEEPEAEAEDNETIQTTLTFWQDGFSIDDGPLRTYQDPANAEFLDYVKKGKIPPEIKAKSGQEVRVLVSNKLEQKYVAPKKINKPFSGSGQRLGSIVPGENPTPSSSNTIQKSPDPVQSTQTQEQTTPSGPTTSIQIRLADGTRMVMKIALDAKISEIRRFINLSRAGESQNYSLMTTFPNKEITDENETIEQAKLANSVVVQKKKL